MAEIVNSWLFTDHLSETPREITEQLITGEEVVDAFKTMRDVAAFTNKRLIVMDAQGITGKKKEIYSIPYRSIIMWSTENAGKVDLSAEVELWTRVGNFKLNLSRGIDVRRFDRLFAEICL